MTQLVDDRSAFGGSLMTLSEALERLREGITPAVDSEAVALRQARGRILAERVVATVSVPPHDNAAVDGYAFHFDDLAPSANSRLRLRGRAAAGHPYEAPVGPGEAVRIFTGAPMPAGCDTVMMQEDCIVDGDHVIVRAGIERGANRRLAGEDVKAGSTVLSAGRRLRAQDLGLAAAVGRRALLVYRQLKAAVFSTGDELIEPGETLLPGGIHDSNRHTLMALLEGLGVIVSDLGIQRDQYETIRAALATAAVDHDLILTSGGMSVGEEDHVKAAVRDLGRLDFWQLAIKPGRPIGFGQVAGAPFIGLPGNPVAMMVTFLRIARPMILRLGGCTETAPTLFRVRAAFSHKKKAGRREWVRARLATDGQGEPIATKFPRQGSGILSSLVEADGLVELPEDLTRLEPGDRVEFLPFSEVSC